VPRYAYVMHQSDQFVVFNENHFELARTPDGELARQFRDEYDCHRNLPVGRQSVHLGGVGVGDSKSAVVDRPDHV